MWFSGGVNLLREKNSAWECFTTPLISFGKIAPHIWYLDLFSDSIWHLSIVRSLQLLLLNENLALFSLESIWNSPQKEFKEKRSHLVPAKVICFVPLARNVVSSAFLLEYMWRLTEKSPLSTSVSEGTTSPYLSFFRPVYQRNSLTHKELLNVRSLNADNHHASGNIQTWSSPRYNLLY